MAEYSKFEYMPLEGRLPGKSFEQQTEDAINDLGQKVVIAIEDAESAVEAAKRAAETASEASKNAEQAAQEARDSANAARQAGEDAKEAAEKARQVSEEAQAAAKAATSASETASQAASSANEAAQKAGAAAEEAAKDVAQAAASASAAEKYAENIEQMVEDLETQDFQGSTAEEEGARGYVPTPPAGSQGKALLGGAVWGGLNDVEGVLSREKGGTGLANPTIRQLLEVFGLPYDHNSYFEEKLVGQFDAVADVEAFIAEHKVSTGDFGDLKIGNIIKIKKSDNAYADWQIAAFDWEWGSGSNQVLWTHNISLIPAGSLESRRMNATNDTTGAYFGSEMHTWLNNEGADGFIAKYLAPLGTHLLTCDRRLTTAMTATADSAAGGNWKGASTAWEWKLAKVVLMAEPDVYGGMMASSHYYDACDGMRQLPFFRFKPFWLTTAEKGRVGFWLRGVVASTGFCAAGSNGDASTNGASNASGLRPLITVG